MELFANLLMAFSKLRPMFPSHRNQLTDLQYISIDWDLYGRAMELNKGVYNQLFSHGHTGTSRFNFEA